MKVFQPKPAAVCLYKGVENSWLEADRPVSLPVRFAVPVWESHLDHKSKGAHSEAPVCGLCNREAAAHCQFYK